MLQLARVRKNAGSLVSPSIIRSDQFYERGPEKPDSGVLDLCKERDRLNSLIPDVSTSRLPINQRGRWTVIDENSQEVEL